MTRPRPPGPPDSGDAPSTRPPGPRDATSPRSSPGQAPSDSSVSRGAPGQEPPPSSGVRPDGPSAGTRAPSGGLRPPRSRSTVMLGDDPGGSGERLLTGDVVWEVTDTGLVCVAAPCPSFRAVRIEGDTRHPEEVVHEVDFARSELSEQESARLHSRLSGGLRVEGRVRLVPNRGPAGSARILEVRRILPAR